ncbi:MAG: glycosyltransferase family 1 protein [Planctomycetota bacterium]
MYRKNLLLDATLIDRRPSGTATRLAGLLEAYVRLFGADELTLLYDSERPPSVELCSAGMRVIASHPPRGPLLRWLFGSRFLEEMVHRAGACAVLTDALPPPRVRSARVLATVHDLRFLDPAISSRLRRTGGRHVVLPRLRTVYRVVAVSDAMARAVCEAARLPPARVVVLPNGVIVPPQRQPRAAPPADQPLTVVVLGHLERRKDPRTALRGFAAWAKREPRARLVVAGSDREGLEGNLRGMARQLELDRRVAFLGPVDAATKETLLASAFAVVLASLHEGFGLVGLEAQAHGTPVVASALASHREVFGDGAWFFLPGQAEELAASLRSLPESWDVLSRLALENARHWTWEATAKALRQVQQEAMADH